MGLLDGLNSLLGVDPEGVQGVGGKKSFAVPRLLQLLALGADIQPLTKEQKKATPKSQKFKFGGATFSLDQVSAQALQDASVAQQQAQVDIQKQSFEALKDSPLYDSLFADSQGGLPNVLDPALSEMAEQALGGAAGSGLNVNDPLVQAKILGPLALQGTLAQKQLQQTAGQNLAAALQGPGSAVAQSAAPGLPFFQNSFFQQQGLNLGAQQFNATAANQAQGAALGLLGSLGGAAIAGFGDPSPAGGISPQAASGFGFGQYPSVLPSYGAI